MTKRSTIGPREVLLPSDHAKAEASFIERNSLDLAGGRSWEDGHRRFPSLRWGLSCAKESAEIRDQCFLLVCLSKRPGGIIWSFSVFSNRFF